MASTTTTTATAALFPRVMLALTLSTSLLTAQLPSASSSSRGLSFRSRGGDDDNKGESGSTALAAAGHPVYVRSSHLPSFAFLLPHQHVRPPPSVAGSNGDATTGKKNVTAHVAEAEMHRLFAGRVVPNLLASTLLVLTAGIMAGLTVGLLGASRRPHAQPPVFCFYSFGGEL